MAHPSNKPAPAGAPEADACTIVTFRVRNTSNGHVSNEVVSFYFLTVSAAFVRSYDRLRR